MIRINASLMIPEEELTFTASRSGGPGGQNVNKVSTRITLLFDVVNSPSLSATQRRRILEAYPTRISKDWIMRVVCQKFRHQGRNRELSIERFCELIREALVVTPPRKRTKIPRSVKKRRVDDKRSRSKLKQQRSKRDLDWDR
jgi:ribosome-associated protein